MAKGWCRSGLVAPVERKPGGQGCEGRGGGVPVYCYPPRGGNHHLKGGQGYSFRSVGF